jgi:DNA-binding NtrC family response regulator
VANTDEIVLPDPADRKPVVLLVEDEVLIRMATSEYLQECGFTVLGASTAAEAIEILQGHDGQIDVVFSDVRMPGAMDGFALAKWVHEHRPGMAVLLTSGDARMADTATGLCKKLELVPKPYDFQLAVARIRQLLGTAKTNGA